MKTHEIKLHPEFYAAHMFGKKPWEIRKDDRNYQEGDAVHLREWSPTHNAYTGRHAYRFITYLLRGGQFGIAEGHVLFTLSEHP